MHKEAAQHMVLHIDFFFKISFKMSKYKLSLHNVGRLRSQWFELVGHFPRER